MIQDNRGLNEYFTHNDALHDALGLQSGASVELHAFGTGEHNRNFWFVNPVDGKRLVLRVNVVPQPFHDNQVAYEYSALELLASSGRTPLPLYLDDSPKAPGYGVIVTTFCEGRMLDYDHLRAGDLAQCARIMADVHAMPVPDNAPLFKPANALVSLFDECTMRILSGKAIAETLVWEWNTIKYR